ncbi:MAG: type II secretion system protein GspG [Deltaproteobacteria bacterium]|nr:type II secretion system protein GspG [Deltaproteobacteria bacterium]
MRRRKEAGFTLIEVVVVVAVIAILAAVLTPYITKYIDDSKIAKARNEVQVIGGAMTNFYKDTGMWPSRSATGGAVATLYTGTVTPAAAAVFTATPPVVPPVATWAGTAAPIDNSLLTNGTGNAYPANGDMQWRGPYAGGALPPDPWGKPYVVNSAVTGPIWVLSAGPNLKVQTARTDNVLRGDDIGFRVR